MTQEEKQLIVKDICGRLPYGLIVEVVGDWFYGEMDPYKKKIWDDFSIITDFIRHSSLEIKPYLRPMSSMTEEEKEEYDKTFDWDYAIQGTPFDWLNAHCFDYRGLIEKGLALEAPEYMYKTD